MPIQVSKDVYALHGRIVALRDEPVHDHETYFDRVRKLEAELDEIDRRAGPGLAVNRVVRFGVADGYAIYLVAKVGPRTCTLLHIPLSDAYHSPAVRPDGKCPTATVREILDRDDARRAATARRQAELDAYFDSLAVGDVVHVRGSGPFSRCAVVEADYTWGDQSGYGKCLRPVALVGRPREQVDGKWVGQYWPHGIYTVDRLGIVSHGLAAKQVLAGKPFRCHPENIYEYDPSRYKAHADPRDLPEIPLHPPEPDALELARRRQWADLLEVESVFHPQDDRGHALGHERRDPLGEMRAAYRMLGEILQKYPPEA